MQRSGLSGLSTSVAQTNSPEQIRPWQQGAPSSLPQTRHTNLPSGDRPQLVFCPGVGPSLVQVPKRPVEPQQGWPAPPQGAHSLPWQAREEHICRTIVQRPSRQIRLSSSPPPQVVASQVLPSLMFSVTLHTGEPVSQEMRVSVQASSRQTVPGVHALTQVPALQEFPWLQPPLAPVEQQGWPRAPQSMQLPARQMRPVPQPVPSGSSPVATQVWLPVVQENVPRLQALLPGRQAPPAAHGTQLPARQTRSVPQPEPSGWRLPVSLQARVPVLQSIRPMRQGLSSGSQSPPWSHRSQDPSRQTDRPSPQGSPLRALPVMLH
jgi:hypothetical protein